MRILLLLITVLAFVSCNGGGGGDSGSGSEAKSGSGSSFVFKLKARADGYPNQDMSSFKMTVYSVHVGENEDCSDLTEIANYDSSPLEVDLMNTYDFGEINVSQGTYNCVAITIDRRMKFNPDSVPAGSGTCTASTENSTYLPDYSVIHNEGHYYNSNEDPVYDKLVTGVRDHDSNPSGDMYGGSPMWTSYSRIGTGITNPYFRVVSWTDTINGVTSGFSDLFTQFGGAFKDADGIPVQKATLYMSTKIGTRHNDFRFVPPYAAEWAEDGADYDGSHDRVFAHSGNEVSNYIVQPLDVTSGNIGEFIIKFTDAVDILDNSTSGECRLQNVSFDFDQVN